MNTLLNAGMTLSAQNGLESVLKTETKSTQNGTYYLKNLQKLLLQ